ncbi:RAMP superfamily CRISPR-associated protein [Pleomorphovibrio marinus]|uniref:RAMP superfamily CRISPR-associated protein n=1 Tax=Pleomorphovibrio marinus TaxID=2164132 RepID=UPI000E0AD217|nr:RAMP superfamily CRISPR-associated protein [Pleomorphovibrio marinus]
MSNFNVKITVLSPIHIGGAQERHYQKGLDVFWDNGTLYYLPLEALSEYMDDSLIQFFANGNKSAILERLKQKSIPFEKIALRKWDCPKEPEQDEIKAFIKTGFGDPILPGSSIKGSVRSHLFKALSKGKVNNVIQSLKYGAKFNRGIEGEVLDYKNGREDIQLLRLFQFSDFLFDKSEILPVKVFNLREYDDEWSGAWKYKSGSGNNEWEFSPHGFITHYEVLPKASSAIGKFNILGKEMLKFNGSYPPQYGQLGFGNGNDLNKLFEIINKNIKNYLQKEIDFFYKYYDDDEVADGQIAPFYEKLKEQASELKDGAILRVGGGSGFHSMTGDWIYDDHLISVEKPYEQYQRGKIKNYTKSRKFTFKKVDGVIEFSPLGWIKIENI